MLQVHNDGGKDGEQLSLENVKRIHVERVLEMCGGNRVRAARILGIGRTSLYRFLKRCQQKQHSLSQT